MLAWIGLLSPDGYVNQILRGLGIAHPPDWLNGNAYSVILALVYGYIPYFILPVFAGLDRIDRSQIEAARDLGATPFQAFLQVTLPLSRPSILAGSALVVLPMFGDYYTNDLISGSPQHQHARQRDQPLRAGRVAEEPRRLTGARADDHHGGGHGVLPVPDRTRHESGSHERARRCPDAPPRAAGRPDGRAGAQRSARLRNPWGEPRFLVAVTWAYIAWALVPVADRDPLLASTPAARAASGRASRSAGGGATPRSRSSTTPALHMRSSTASCSPALDMLIATPLGVLLALGLARWRGRGSGVANSLMLDPAGDARDRHGGVAAGRLHPAGARAVQPGPPRHAAPRSSAR